MADRLAAVLATQVLAAFEIAWDESTVGILSVLVFGAGTDYALLLISRYRDELRSTEDRFAAMAQALRRTAEAVLSSATTVVLGLLTLLLSLIPTTRGLGLACAVGVVVAAAFVLVVLPAALVVFGRWIFWPKVPRVGQAPLVESRSLWRRVGDRVAGRPVTFLLVSARAARRADERGAAHRDRAERLRPVPGHPGGDHRRRAARRVLPGRQLRPGAGPHPRRRRRGARRRRATSRAWSRAEETRSGGGLAQVDVVVDAAPGSEASRDAVLAIRDAVDRGSRRPTSAAPRPRRSMPVTPRPGTGG